MDSLIIVLRTLVNKTLIKIVWNHVKKKVNSCVYFYGHKKIDKEIAL